MKMLRKLLLKLRVETNLNELAYLMFAFRYFDVDVSGFLEVVWSHLGEFFVLAVCLP